MKKITTKALAIVSLIAVMAACSKNKIIEDLNPTARYATSGARIAEDEQQAMRKEFGIALAKALKESKELRALIKAKAMEMIDEDYDVLFAFIRDERLTNELTVKELLARQFDRNDRLIQIEEAIPTLTIFVPKLPNNTFSAESWDVDTQIPLVAIKSIKSNDVPIVDDKGTEATLPSKYVPGFPVVVVKNSLRIIDDTHPSFGKAKAVSRFSSTNKRSYKFLSDNFDRKEKEKRKKGARTYLDYSIENKIKNAYDIFGTNPNYWQRDHIYYNLNLTNTQGNLDFQFKEALTSFRLDSSNPMAIYNEISDATDGSDPRLTGTESQDQNTFWTGGSYTFRIHIISKSTTSTTGTEHTDLIPIAPWELWDVQYQTIYLPPTWPWQPAREVYIPTGVTPKTVNMRHFLFVWNLKEYATKILVKTNKKCLIFTVLGVTPVGM